MRPDLAARRVELKAAIRRARSLGERYKTRPSPELNAQFARAFNEVRHLAFEIAQEEIEAIANEPRTQPARAAPQ